jgi:hypothetical protein
MQEARQ